MGTFNPQLNYQSEFSTPLPQVIQLQGNAFPSEASLTGITAGALTTEVWVKTTQSDTNAIVLSYTDIDSTPNRLWVKNPADISVGYNDKDTGSTGIAINDGYWHHLVVVVAPGNDTHFQVLLYKDGVAVYQALGGIAVSSGSVIADGGSLVLGQAKAASSEVDFAGEMSEFRLWNGIQSADDILNNFEQVISSGPLISWLLNSVANSGTIIGGGTPTYANSSLNYRTLQLLAGWSDTGAASYDLRLTDLGTGKVQNFSGISGTSYSISSFNVNHYYQLEIKAGTDANWSSETVNTRIMNLQQVQAILSSPAADKLQAGWTATDQTSEYLVSLFKNGNADPESTSSQSGTTYDLTSLLSSEDAYNFTFQAQSENSSGPSQSPATVGTIDLSFYYVAQTGGNGYLQLGWNNQADIDFYYVEIFKGPPATATLAYSSLVAGDTNSLRVDESEVPVSPGDQLQARIRGIASGVIAIWTAKVEITATDLAVPVLSYNYLSASDDLQLIWQPVTNADTYRIRIYQDGDATPIVDQSGLTDTYYSLKPYMYTAHTYTFTVQAVADGSIGPPNDIVQPNALNEQFLYQGTSGELVLSWDSVPNAMMNIVPPGASPEDQNQLQAGTTTSYTVTPPQGGYQQGDLYNFKLRPLDTGAMGPLSSGSVKIYDLNTAPVLTYDYDNTQNPAVFTAQWQDIRTQAQKDANLDVQYQVQLTIDGVQQALITQAGLTYDLTDELVFTQDKAVTVAVRGAVLQDNSKPENASISPDSAITPATDISLQLNYYNESTELTASWNSATPVYLQAYKSGEETLAQTYYASAAETSWVIETGALTDGDEYIVQAKSLPEGTISAPFEGQAIIHSLAKTVLALSYDSGSNQLAVNWPDVRTQAQIDNNLAVTYTATLTKNSDAPVLSTGIPNTAEGRVFDWPALDEAGAYTLMITGVSEGSVGLPNTQQSLGAIAISSFSFHLPENQLQAVWGSVTNAESYYAFIKKNGTEGSHAYRNTVPTDSAPQTFDASGAVNGDQFELDLRAVNAGAWTDLVTASVTVLQIPAPVLDSPWDADVGSNQLTISWSFSNNAVPSPTYKADLLQDGVVIDSQTTTDTRLTFTNPAIVDGATLTTRVQVLSNNNYGAYDSMTGTISDSGTIPQVTGLTACSSTAVNLTANWNTVSVEGVTFELEVLSTSGSVVCTKTNINGTSVDLPQSENKMEAGTDYKVRVRAVKGSIQGVYSDDASVTAGQPCSNPNPNPPTDGDPVDLVNGALGYSNADMEVNGVVKLSFMTSYRSITPLSEDNDPTNNGKVMGERWNHSYNTLIYRDIPNKKVYVVWGTGGANVFKEPNSISGNYAPADVPNGSALFYGSDEYYVLTQADQTKYYFRDTNGNGVANLEKIVNPIGQQVTLSYAGGRLDKITDDQSQRFMQLSYHTDGLVSGVTDNAGRSVSYNYSNGNLVTWTDVNGHDTTFAYTGESLIETITDQNNTVYLKNRYNANNQVEFQQSGNAIASGSNAGLSFAYAESQENGVDLVTTTVTDAEGFETIYKSIKTNSEVLEKTQYLDLAKSSMIKTLYTYDGYNNVLTETSYEGPVSGDPNTGTVITNTYVGISNLATSSYENPIGMVLSRSYDANNNILTDTDAAGNITHYEYNVDNTLKQITNPLGQIQSYVYYNSGVAKGLMKSQTDFNGNTTSYVYSSNGDLKTITNALGEVTVITSDDKGMIKSRAVQDAAQNTLRTRSYEYNTSGQLTHSVTQMAGQSGANAYASQLEYDNQGLLTSITNAAGKATQFGYDNNDNHTTTTFPSQSSPAPEQITAYNSDNFEVSRQYSPSVIEQYTVDPTGRRLSFTDPNQNVYDYAYAMQFISGAPNHTSVQTTYPKLTGMTEAYTSQTVLDVLGRTVSDLYTSGQQTDYGYSYPTDSSTHTNDIQVTVTLPPADPSKAEERYTIVRLYDALGRLKSVTDQSGKLTTYDYTPEAAEEGDSFNQLVTITNPLGEKSIHKFDALGRLTEERIADDSETLQSKTFTYDALDRILQCEEKLQSGVLTTHYTYSFDDTLNLIVVSVGQPGNDSAVSSLYYNGLGLLVKETDPAGATTQYTYDDQGRIQTVTNAAGVAVTYGYDAAGRYNSLGFQDGSAITQVLDANGNSTVTQQDGTSVISRTFDELNRMLSRTDSLAKTVDYSYNAANQVDSITYPGGHTVNYAYNGLQQLKTVTDWLQKESQYTYSPLGLVDTLTLPNGTVTAYDYDDVGRLKSILSKSGADYLYSAQYTLNALGERLTADIIQPIPPQYAAANLPATYNSADQLLDFNGQPASYDPNGNMTGIPANGNALQYDVFNRVTSFGATHYTYDADGLRVQQENDTETLKYVQNVNGWTNPYMARASTGNGITETDLLNNAFGNYEIVPAEVALSLDPNLSLNQLLQIYDGNDVLQKEFVYGLGLLCEVNEGDSPAYYHFDARGSTMALTNSTGGVTDAWAYDAYGAVVNRSGSANTCFQYNGRQGTITDDSGLLYMRARYYHPGLMRFLEKDFLFGSLENPESLNRYVYVTGNPINYTDPYGLDKNVGLIVLGVLGGLAVGGAAIAGGLYLLGGGGSAAGGIGGAISAGAARVGSALRPGNGYNRVPTEDPFEGTELQPMPPEGGGANSANWRQQSNGTWYRGSRASYEQLSQSEIQTSSGSASEFSGSPSRINTGVGSRGSTAGKFKAD